MLNKFKQLTTISKIAVIFAAFIVVFEIYSTATTIVSLRQDYSLYGQLFAENLGIIVVNVIGSLLVPFGLVLVLLQGARYKQEKVTTYNTDNTDNTEEKTIEEQATTDEEPKEEIKEEKSSETKEELIKKESSESVEEVSEIKEELPAEETSEAKEDSTEKKEKPVKVVLKKDKKRAQVRRKTKE